jgi:hypothetical protein
MKRLLLLVSCALALGACSMPSANMEPPPVMPPASAAQSHGDGAAQVERIRFRPGVSSVTVERLAKQQACNSNEGAGLVTEPGPVEVYRMMCDNGKVFMARCELRQCRAM